MFPVLQSPCVFEPLPMVNVFGGDQLSFSPEPKRRRAVEGPCRYGRNLPRESSISLRYTVTKAPEGYVLSLYKKLPKGKLLEAVNQKLSDIKERSYRPTYHIVHDIYGNPYYLEEEVDENQLLRDALSKLDMKAIHRKLAKELFQDYEIELNHRGDELSVSSRKDDISRAFEIGECIDDVEVLGCKLDETQEYCILKIGLVKRNKNNVGSDNLAKLIEWSQSNAEEEEQCRIRTEQKRAFEEKSRAKAASEARAQAEAVAAANAKAASEAKAQAEAAAAANAKAASEAKAQAEAAASARKIEEQKAKDAKKQERRKKKDDKIQRRIAEEKKKQVKEKKSFLIEQQKAKRLGAEKMSSADSSPKVVTININFGDDSTTMRKTQEEDGHRLRRYSSPILEDVDDAEFNRFDESSNRSPRGSSVIEDM